MGIDGITQLYQKKKNIASKKVMEHKKTKEETAKSKEQRAKSKEQRAKSKEEERLMDMWRERKS